MVKNMVQIKVLGENTGSLSQVSGFRDEQGRYTSAQAEQLVRNKLFAELLREQVGRRIENRISFGKRSAASTGNLLRQSVSTQNTVVTKEFVGIGVDSWLNARAKYWRTFELGSLEAWGRPFVGTQLYPYGGRSEGYSAHGQRPGIRTAKGVEPRSDGRFVVKHEIQGAHIYKDVFEANKGAIHQFQITSARKFLNRIFGTANNVVAGPPTGSPSASQLYG